jgi:hypothetical protein
MNTKILSLNKTPFSPNSFLLKSLYEPISWKEGEKKRRKKIPQDGFEIPEYKEHEKIKTTNHNVFQLKQICRFYKQKVSGNKTQLVFRIYNYLRFSYHINIIQKNFRGWLTRKLESLKGPAYRDRKCNNIKDFMTLDKLSDLSETQFYSYKDEKGFIYGFDICSLHNLFKESCKKLNPYTRKHFPKNLKKQVRQIIRLSHILNRNIVIDLEADDPEDKEIEFNAIKIFQILDSFGHVTDTDWFMTLNRNYLIKYIRELFDIWNYRAQLTPEVKRKICPPNGKPFGTELVNSLHNRTYDYLQKYCLKVMNNFVTLGEDIEMHKLGAIYVLGGLTIVNSQAAEAFPWLYHSFAPNI